MGQKLEEQHERMLRRHEMAMMRLDIARSEQTLQVMSAIPTFAQDRDEREWMIVTDTRTKQPYTIMQLDSIRQSAARLQRKPAGRNILQTFQDFIIGRDATVTTDDEDLDGKRQEYWDGWAVENKFDLKTKEIVKRLFRDGEVFLRWFLPTIRRGHLQIRFVNPSQIRPTANGKPTYGISVDPDDYEKINDYYRQWTAQSGQLRNEKIPADEMDHWKINCDSDEKRGVSVFEGLGKYITDYAKWLDDRIAINRIRHIWNVIGEPTSGVTPITDLKNKFEDVTYTTPPGQEANKKVPKSGSVLFSRGMKWKLDSLNINAADTKDDGRAIQLQLAIGANMPEYIIRGDASNANYASTMVSESPFVRSMESWQDYVDKIFAKIYTRVMEWGISMGPVPAKSTKTTVTFNAEKGEDDTETETVPTVTECTVNFAALIHRDEKADTEAKQIQVAEDFVSRKTASEKLGYDYDAEQDQIAREKHQRAKEAAAAEEAFGEQHEEESEEQ